MSKPTRIAGARRPALAAMMAATALLVAACGTGAGLIPETNAGPLSSDFEAVAQAARTGNGNCTRTERALRKTQRDFEALPSSVDRRLHRQLEKGIANLRERAMQACEQPVASTTTTTATTSTTTSSSTTSSTTSEPPSTSSSTTTTSSTATEQPSVTVTTSEGGSSSSPESYEETGGAAPGEGEAQGVEGQQGGVP